MQSEFYPIAFTRRAPVADPKIAKLGPWLWVSNPKISYSHKKHEEKTDLNDFVRGGSLLLQAFEAQKDEVESSLPNAQPASITRKMRPHKDQLKDDLLFLAVKTSTTCGKWMLFPKPDDYPRYWRLIAEATAEGRLGPTSKAATVDLPNSSGLICVYTYDFTDMQDVRRVLEELIELGVCHVDSKVIYYKCDAHTYLDIKSDNKYKLRASLYSSKEVLDGEAKAKQDEPIARLKKADKKIDSFFAS